MNNARNATLLIALTVLSACGGSTTRPPTAPTLPIAPVPIPPAAGPGPSAQAGPGHGTLTIREVSPVSGATLAVRECPAGNVTRICTDAWRGTFDVLVDREMTYAVLTASFWDGQTLCGYGANVSDLVPAGQRVSFTIDRIFFSDAYRLASPCRLPVATARIEVELWSDSSSWTNTLMQEFNIAYTFE